MPTATTSTLATRAKYGVKAVFTILSHVPPTLDQVIERRKPALLDGISYQDRLKFACDNPPLNSAGVQSATPQRHSLTITGAMPRFSGSGPHVVTCQLDNDKTTYVAKIFDGMDYPLPTQAILEQDDPWDDFMSQADYDYSAEARAYEFLQEPAANIRLEDLPIPEYHGSWTLTLPIEKYRPVRLVLLEYIKGESLATIIDRKALPSETERLKLLAKIVEADEYLKWAGVDHKDMAPRNVMVTSSGIKIIDFNRAAVWAKHEGKSSLMRYLYGWPNKLPPSPIQRKWICPGLGNSSWFLLFEKWLPASWIIEEQDDEDIKVIISEESANEWLVTTFKNSPKYQPLTQRFMTKRWHARESRKLKGLIGYKG